MADKDAVTQDDIAAIRVAASTVKDLSARMYGKEGLQADRMRAEKAEAVADKLERRLRA